MDRQHGFKIISRIFQSLDAEADNAMKLREAEDNNPDYVFVNIDEMKVDDVIVKLIRLWKENNINLTRYKNTINSMLNDSIVNKNIEMFRAIFQEIPDLDWLHNSLKNEHQIPNKQFARAIVESKQRPWTILRCALRQKNMSVMKFMLGGVNTLPTSRLVKFKDLMVKCMGWMVRNGDLPTVKYLHSIMMNTISENYKLNWENEYNLFYAAIHSKNREMVIYVFRYIVDLWKILKNVDLNYIFYLWNCDDIQFMCNIFVNDMNMPVSLFKTSRFVDFFSQKKMSKSS